MDVEPGTPLSWRAGLRLDRFERERHGSAAQVERELHGSWLDADRERHGTVEAIQREARRARVRRP